MADYKVGFCLKRHEGRESVYLNPDGKLLASASKKNSQTKTMSERKVVFSLNKRVLLVISVQIGKVWAWDILTTQ
jgi:hypothetical protein